MSLNKIEWKEAVHSRVFSNDGAAALDIFTVTGDVIVKVVCVCDVLLASVAAANMELGVASDTDALVASTLATDVDANEIWHDASPDSDIELLTVRDEFIIVNGADIILTIDAQVDTGTLRFICHWIPLEGESTVVAA